MITMTWGDAMSSEQGTDDQVEDKPADRPPGPDSEPEYNDREKLDFDPDDGLYTGTAVDGGTSIPGPHVQVDDVDPEAAGPDGE